MFDSAGDTRAQTSFTPEAWPRVDEPYAFFGDRHWMEVSPQHSPHLALALCKHDDSFVDRLVAHRTKKGTNMLSCAAIGGNRELVDLLLSKGLSPTEIARRTGEPAGTVRSRTSRGLDRLRESLDDSHDGERRSWKLSLISLLSKPELRTAAVAAGEATS